MFFHILIENISSKYMTTKLPGKGFKV